MPDLSTSSEYSPQTGTRTLQPPGMTSFYCSGTFPAWKAVIRGTKNTGSGNLVVKWAGGGAGREGIWERQIKRTSPGNSLVVQWLRLSAFTAMGPGSIPDRGTIIRSHKPWGAAKKKDKCRTGPAPGEATGADSEWARGPEMSSSYSWATDLELRKLTWGLTIRSTVAAAWSPTFPTWGRAGTGEAC